ncbi:MAG: uroporphyrinogen decarboxylase [Micrococcales bacterium]|nr:uroporphyrinogen decarboxylase [Micrococcales bacterium]MCL2668136.1 uroporphyrinogen decarboxylase [Micrococcales bacterium]
MESSPDRPGDDILSGKPLLEAFTGRRPSTFPVWFMRQAGRSLPEYREARASTTMLEACLDPDLAAEITCQPVRRHGVDAAIFFSDIVVPLALAGVDVTIEPGVGPVFAHPVRTVADVAALTEAGPPDAAALEPVAAGVRAAVALLGETPLIGFAGAPFTLAAYLAQGRASRDHLAARRLMHTDPAAWSALMDFAAAVSAAFLVAQIRAGAVAVQLFDSWVGSLRESDYRAHVLPASAAVLAAAKAEGVPTVHFGTGTGELLTALRDAGADVVGVDHRVTLDAAVGRLGGTTPVQGNIDPALLAAPWPVLEAHVRDVVDRGRAAPGHVVNLGHGVPPDADPDVLTRIVRLVHSL